MAHDTQQIWIETGYEIFAREGHNALKVERLARVVGKSKSSFYHHFADLDLFIEILLKHHLEQSKTIAKKEQEARNIDPELISILVEHRIDMLFNRQLRINKQLPSFASALDQSNRIVGNAFIQLWAKDLKLSPQQLEGLFTLALENFFLQIHEDNLTISWLSGYFSELKRIARNFA